MEITDMIYENYDCLILRDQEFNRCTFRKCTIPGIINCTFYNCIFTECDFLGIIKNSKFLECDIRKDNRFDADLDKVYIYNYDDFELAHRCETCGANGLKIDLFVCEVCGETVCANCVKYIDGDPICPKCYTQGTCIDCGETCGAKGHLCSRCGEMVCADCVKYIDGDPICPKCYATYLCIDCGQEKGDNMFLCGRCGEIVCTDCMKYVDGEGYCLHCYKEEFGRTGL